ncbi:MAG: hypothetical protein ABI216_05315 [Devosia sp.]
MTHRFPIALALISILALGVPALSSLPATAAEAPVAPEHNPPGDIPDSQVFITYTGSGVSMKVPEGWSRRDLVDGANFSDKYNLVEIRVAKADHASTAATAKTNEAKDLLATGRATEISKIMDEKLDGGTAVRIDYASNSEPNAVTNKQIRLERVRYLLFKNSTLVTLDMAAPFGADNVDQWRLMANSVRLD